MADSPSASGIIEFTSAEQILTRPMFRSDLQMSEEDLDRIVGKYDLRTSTAPKPMVCGLNGCHEPHGKGFVVRKKDGCETVCGHLCGARHLHQRWAEVFATYQRESEAALRLSVATQMHAEQAEMRRRAKALAGPCRSAESAVVELLNELRVHRGFLKHIETCARSGGAILVASSGSALDSASARTSTMVRAGWLHGAGLLTTNPTSFSHLIKMRVLPWCDKCASIESISALGETEIAALVRDGAGHRETLRRAQAFLDEAYGLFDIENLKKLGIIRQHLLRSKEDSQSLQWLLADLVKRSRLPRPDGN